MRHSRQFSRLVFVTLAGGILFATVQARAGASCATDVDCGKGFKCEASGVTSCPPTPACAKGDECSPAPECSSAAVLTCVLASCTVDSDCADGMACSITTEQSCSSAGNGSKCSLPDASCPTPPPPTCTTYTYGTCTPKYNLPCKVDSDCGSGFTCIPEPCECAPSLQSGGGSTSNVGVVNPGGPAIWADASSRAVPEDAAAADVAVPDPVDDAATPIVAPVDAACACPAVPVNECQLNPISCAVDKDCPTTWTCQLENSVSCACPMIVMTDGSSPPCVCPDASSTGTCIPPYWKGSTGTLSTNPGTPSTGSTAADGGGGKNTGEGNTGPGEETDAGSASATDAGAVDTTATPVSDSGRGVLPVSSPSGIDAADASGAASQGATETPPSTGNTNDNSSGGCQIGAARSSNSASGLLAMALLALSVSIGRRRLSASQRGR